MINNKKILITGATGFVGSCLAHRLVETGCELHLTVRAESNLWRIKNILDKVNLHNLDLRNKNNVESVVTSLKPKVIYHCATYGGYYTQSDAKKILGTNITGIVNLLNACAKAGFDCFVNTGSSSEYGIKNGPIKESDTLEPVSSYGAAKTSSTLFCQSVFRRNQLPIVNLRLFSPYGYYEAARRLIPSVIISCLSGKDVKLSSPDSVRDFVFIEDVVDAYLKVTEIISKAKGEIFNIGSGRQYSVGEVVSKIIELTGGKIKPEWKTMPNPRIEPAVWIADISKAKDILKWQPEYTLERGLKNTVKWFKENVFLYRETVNEVKA